MKRLVILRPWLALCLGAFCVFGAAAQDGASARPTGAPDPRARARIHTELGSAYFEAGHMSAALDELRIALDIDSGYVPAYSVRGLVYSNLKEYAKAEVDFRQALSIAPRDPEVNNNYGWYLCQTGRERQSITYFMQALKDPLYSTPGAAYTNAGNCALKAGDIDAAQDYLLNAVRYAQDGALAARLKLAEVFYRKNILSEAKIYLADVLKMADPPSAEALWLGIRIERRLGNRGLEGGYAAQLRNRYPTSSEYQEFLKGKFE